MKAKFQFSVILVASFFALSFQSANNVSSTLSVTVTGTKNSSGEIDFNLFNKADGFPDDATKSFKHVREKISNGKCSVTFKIYPSENMQSLFITMQIATTNAMKHGMECRKKELVFQTIHL